MGIEDFRLWMHEARWIWVKLHPNFLEPPPSGEELRRFIDWILDESAVAARPSVSGRKNLFPMRGKGISWGAGKLPFRGSDFRLRLFLAVEAKKRTRGKGINPYFLVGQHPTVQTRLGKSKRGQHSKSGAPIRDPIAETVRSLYNKYKHPLKNRQPDFWLVQFRTLELDYDLHSELWNVFRRAYRFPTDFSMVAMFQMDFPTQAKGGPFTRLAEWSEIRNFFTTKVSDHQRTLPGKGATLAQ